MYKVASSRRQSALHRGKPWDWANGEMAISAEHELESVRKALAGLEAQIVLLPAGSEERRAVGLRKIELQNRSKELKEITGKVKRLRQGVSQFFVDIAKRELLPGQFDRMWRAAEANFDQMEIEAAAYLDTSARIPHT